jgi:hypothetical protein
MPCLTCCHPAHFRDPQRHAGDDARKIARLKFQPASNSFDVSNATVFEIAAMQRCWRDFRMTPSGFERADPRCQKIGRRRLSRPTRKNGGGLR